MKRSRKQLTEYQSPEQSAFSSPEVGRTERPLRVGVNLIAGFAQVAPVQIVLRMADPPSSHTEIVCCCII